jgi:murein DD-endopeptidase MepM/ murein hydrolase activator NlpD
MTGHCHKGLLSEFLPGAIGSAVMLLLYPGAATAGTTLAQQVEATEETPAVITISKASDGLGAAIELHPARTGRVSGRSIARPDRLPLAAASLTSRFGMRAHPTLGGYRMHSGVDLAAPTGSPVVAPSAGIVSFANWRGGYGLLVILEHGNGLQTRYGHLLRAMVSAGQRVERGQLVGLVGSSGRATGPHLHYEVRQHGLAVDPLVRR